MKLVASSCAQPDIYLMVIENKFVVALRATSELMRRKVGPESQCLEVNVRR
jgi:hypothetical protein